MIYLLLSLIVGIQIAPFIFFNIDIWHAEGIIAQFLILILFSCSFINKKVFQKVFSMPLFLLNIWIGTTTAVICFIAQHNGKYDIQHFFPYFNFLCLIMLYKFMTETLESKDIKLALDFMRYCVVANLLISVLQYFGLSQFFSLLHPDNKFYNNIVTGFIGNGTHLSGFLGMCSPLFFGKSRQNLLCLILMGLVMSISGTTVDEPSISGYIVGIVLILIYLWLNYKKRFFLYFFSIMAIISASLMILPTQIVSKLFAPNGRLVIWEFYYKIFKQYALTGSGLGTMNLVYQVSPVPDARHMHMEYFQFGMELGLIGVGLIFYLIWEFLKMSHDTELKVTSKLIVSGFLLSCCFNYPAHLWMSSVYAMIAYAGLVVLNRGDKIYV